MVSFTCFLTRHKDGFALESTAVIYIPLNQFVTCEPSYHVVGKHRPHGAASDRYSGQQLHLKSQLTAHITQQIVIELVLR